MTKNDEQTMPMFTVQKDTMKPSTTQTTYHNPLKELYFGIDYELVFRYASISLKGHVWSCAVIC
jgi:hypothetical protein